MYVLCLYITHVINYSEINHEMAGHARHDEQKTILHCVRRSELIRNLHLLFVKNKSKFENN